MTFNWQPMVEWIKPGLNGFLNALLIILPSAFIVRTLFDVVIYYTKDEQERQQSPLSRRIKGNLSWFIFAMSISIILKIIGVSI